MASYPVVVFEYTAKVQEELNYILVEILYYMDFSQHVNFVNFAILKKYGNENDEGALSTGLQELMEFG